MGAHEELEHAEHTGHTSSTHLGVTMALLAVLIAFAAAMVGSQRQELMTSMMDQSWAHSSFTAASTKFRLVMLELEKLRATAAPGSASPTLPRLLRLYSDYKDDRKLAQTWDDACEPLIDAHFDAAEGYEHAQLIAEVAIIIASLAVLLHSRIAWILSVVVGGLCLVLIGYTFVTARTAIAENHEKVHAAEHAYDEEVDQHTDSPEDDKVVNDLDPGGKIRASFAESEKASPGETKPAKQGEEPRHEPAKPDED